MQKKFIYNILFRLKKLKDDFMKNLNTTIKKITITSILVLMLVFSCSFSLLTLLNFSKEKVFADSENARTAISISNSNFTEGSGSGLTTPSSWTGVGTKGASKTGIINTNSSTFSENSETYNLNFNPSKPGVSSDDKILMINNGDIPSNYGYESSSFTLSKNGYYMISCFVLTEYSTNASTASLYLSSTSFDSMDESKIELFSTKGSWKEFRFYVKINQSSQSTKLVLYAGSKNSKTSGAVFFDNVNAYQLTEKQYYNEINNSTVGNKIISLSKKDVTITNGISNGDFEDNSYSGFNFQSNSTSSTIGNVAKVVGIGQKFNELDSSLSESENPTSASRQNNDYALLINHKSSGSVKFTSSDILFERHKLYALSVDVKTSNFTSGGAKIEIIQQNPFESDKFTPKTQSFTQINTSSKTNSVSNNWITYTFLISGNAFKDCKANLVLSTESGTVGYVFFDNIKLYEITTSEYDGLSSGENITTADFSNLTSSPKITNGYFNGVEISSTEEAQYSPKDFSVESDNNNNYVIIENEYETYSNILKVANTQLGYQFVTSEEFTLSASTQDSEKYYKISVDVKTVGTENGANIKICDTDGNSIAKLNNIDTNETFKTVNFYVKTFNTDVSAKITLGLGTSVKKEVGYAYFDNLTYSETTKDVFESASADEFTFITNLSKIDTSLFGETQSNGYYSADNFTGTKVEGSGQTDAGIIDISQNSHLVCSNYTNKNVLAIHNYQDANYCLTSNSYSLKSEKYYKISVNVKTKNLNQQPESKQTDADGNAIDYGARIEISGIQAKFSAIKAENNFETYTFYIASTTDSKINFVLGLGNENALTSGYALFDNINIVEISEDDFKLAEKNYNDSDTKTLIVGNTDEEITDEDDTTTENVSTNFDWLVVPSLIIGIALLIAMVGLLIKKINIKLPKKAIKNNYDRAKTLIKDHDKREKIKQREERLKALRERLAEIENEISLNKNEFKNSKTLKEELKVEHEKIEEKIKQTFEDVQSKQAIIETKKLKAEAKLRIKLLRQERYELKRKELIAKYEEIEKEIEAIMEEERLLVEEWRAYRKSQKIKKQNRKKNKRK